MSKPVQIPVKVVTNESQAKLIFDPMRREILRLLSKRTYTAKDLSDIIGLTPPSIGHHLKALLQGELISLVRQEPESHGIMQKWYHANAKAFIVDKEVLPAWLRRYFMPVDLERARAFTACMTILRRDMIASTSHLESLANQICRSICKTAQNFDADGEDDPERIVHRLYVRALEPLVG